ncbi:ABC transporter ATP-binding protein [Acidaminobacter sp. JC074]|uniref:ATP-binding cassette domain-containing protein n=1 Tax=Acidaminobacter sp. JC074 TaxID=2530199 RepID=UPI001F0CFA2B|nr:ABC transporter ATP-binding protein [Acidaminobacter sp. JC074]MCH4891035.1 ABC transporter ATP-binding protein [Acidaminobacter sp. JC074]
MERVLLSVQGLSVSVDHEPLIKDINFELRQGEIVSILGLSGCGKSLTCKAILNLLNKRVFDIDGLVSFEKKDIYGLSKKDMCQLRSDLCLIMQNPLTAFNPLTKIGKQLMETMILHKKVTKNQAENILKKVLLELNLTNIDWIFNAYPHTLSGGMLQRLMIGLALALEPKLIIADEITSSIDAATKKAVLEEILRMKKRGISVLYVSHDINEVRYISDRIMVMEKGQIIEEGHVDQIMLAPKHAHTKLLMTSSLTRTS